MPIGLIFFDLDETLGFFRNYDGSMNSEGFPTGIFLRKYIRDILEKLNKDFVLFITTAATLNYTKAVLEHSQLTSYFHGIFTRNDFVKLENATDANKEASPGGYEKRYSRFMKHYGFKLEDAIHGLVIGDNDYDISCDVPGLHTFIVDSLFIPADILYTIIRDVYDKKELNYSDLGIKIIKKNQKHPIADLETTIFEIECPESLLSIELEKIDVLLTEEEKMDMKVQPEEKIVAEKLSKEQESVNLLQAENNSKKFSEEADNSKETIEKTEENVENKTKGEREEKIEKEGKKEKKEKKVKKEKKNSDKIDFHK